MRRAETWADATLGRVVHFAGQVTDDVFDFLGPATQALAESGVEQTVVLVDDLRFRHLLPRFHDTVEIVLTPASGNPLRRWQWALQALQDALSSSPQQVRVVQLHGLLPCLLGGWIARRAGLTVARRYTARGPLRPAPTVGLPSDVSLLTPRPPPVEMIESPLNSEFFEVPRNEAGRPLVVAGHLVNTPRSVELFAQLAVLLGGEDLGLAFNWLGTVDHGSMVRLTAAQVAVFPVKSESERACRLASGWMYVATGGDRGFPTLLVEAMAVGVPCVALDTPEHRRVIRHSETGFLCRSQQEMVECIAGLIDSPELRLQIGQAARHEAERRFGPTSFRDSLFAAYELLAEPRRPAASP